MLSPASDCFSPSDGLPKFHMHNNSLFCYILPDILLKIIPRSVMSKRNSQTCQLRWNLLLAPKKQVCDLSMLLRWALVSLDTLVDLSASCSPSALELMRQKIEMSTERIRVAKLKEEQARKVCLTVPPPPSLSILFQQIKGSKSNFSTIKGS